MRQYFLRPLVSYYHLDHPVDWHKQFSSKALHPLEVEIGFGMGEILVNHSLNFPQRNFIGIEQIWERIYKTLQRVDKAEQILDNVKILSIDARTAFERLFISESIDKIYSLFPCPWPKKKHIKHRLFSADFFKLLNNRLKPSGEIQIVTDAGYYFDWIVGQIEGAGFQFNTEKIKPRFDTKFERKWRNEGQEEFFEINLYKTEHKDVLVKEDVELKAYKVEQFDPKQFHFKDRYGEISIIFKELLFDADKQKGIVFLLVAEQELTQHIRVAIIKRKNGWRICKADGQNFFPTPGIVLAIELVYKVIISKKD